ncbi:hypothetical protein CUC00_09295 [Prevotella intermedia]|uniref:hypothetical protein n=1 Tax=Prevotella intermedia TaxID=28131 RepID=UPI000C1B9DC6|nr:hypothetical protein [Prevotella intermedia]ATV32378.1 hypothetical protein CTM44_00640 [Prevotella intermedia]ATV41212.1 hypothetical protein CUC00_09295 [Prevotella intermedia]
MKRILLALLVTVFTLSVSAQIKKTDDGYYIYAAFSYPSIKIKSFNQSYAPIFRIIAFGKTALVTENGKAVLFNSGVAVKNYLSLKGWECITNEVLLNYYRKKVTKEELFREVEKCKILLEPAEAIKEYTDAVNASPTLAGHRMLEVVEQTEL